MNRKLKRRLVKLKAFLEKRPKKVFWAGVTLLVLSQGASVFQHYYFESRTKEKSKDYGFFTDPSALGSREKTSVLKFERQLKELEALKEKSVLDGLSPEDSLRAQMLTTQLNSQLK